MEKLMASMRSAGMGDSMSMYSKDDMEDLAAGGMEGIGMDGYGDPYGDSAMGAGNMEF